MKGKKKGDKEKKGGKFSVIIILNHNKQLGSMEQCYE